MSERVEDFGAAFRRERELHGVHLRELGLPEYVLSSIELGKRHADRATRARLVARLDAVISQRSDAALVEAARSYLRDSVPWQEDEHAQACVRLHPGGLEVERVADLLGVSLRCAYADLASALSKLREASESDTEHGRLVRQWTQDVIAAQEARDARRTQHEMDADSWDPEGETSPDEMYSRTRESHPGFPNGVRVKHLVRAAAFNVRNRSNRVTRGAM